MAALVLGAHAPAGAAVRVMAALGVVCLFLELTRRVSPRAIGRAGSAAPARYATMRE
jgi:hypothetical protein